MIQDLDESLRTLVRRDALQGSDVDIAFDAPTREWSAHRNTPTVDLYLYDIREDLQRRTVAWEPVRDENGRVTERRAPARAYKLSYLVTAWTQRPEDEHRLLSAMLLCFLRHERMPDDVLAGTLAGTMVPVLTTIALPPPPDRSLSDVWSALGGELKPSLDLVVTAPFDVQRQQAAGPPVEGGVTLQMGERGGRPAAEGASPAAEERAPRANEGAPHGRGRTRSRARPAR
jgi:hypothetical protein